MKGEFDYLTNLHKLEQLSPSLKPIIDELFTISSKEELEKFVDRYCDNSIKCDKKLDLEALKEEVAYHFIERHFKERK